MSGDEPTLFGWWCTYGLLTTLLPAGDREAALEAARRLFSRHRHREVRLEDLVIRPAYERDVVVFEAGRDRKWVPPEPEVADVPIHPGQGSIL